MTTPYEAERFFFYCNNIPGYIALSNQDKRKAKRDYNMRAKACAPKPCNYICPTATVAQYPTISFAHCVQAMAMPQYQKKEETMDNLDNNQREYLNRRGQEVWYAKRDELLVTFRINDDNSPTNAEELVQRITEGKYTIVKRDEDYDGFEYSPFDRMRWRAPDNKPDHAGYDAALERLGTAKQVLKDNIALTPVADAFKAFQAFEATDFSKA